MSSNKSDAEKKKKFFKKYPALKEGEVLVKDKDTRQITVAKKSFAEKPRTVEDEIRSQQEAKKSYESDIAKVEENLVEFLKIEDPIIDPKSGKVIAWMRRPSNKEIRNLVPKELQKYVGKPEEIPDKLLDKYDERIYKAMGELITKPKWSADKWDRMNNPWFTRLFWAHITAIIEITQGEIEGF